MASLPWFRFYSEFAGDPVVQSLAFEDQRHFVMLLCLKCNGTLDRDIPAARRDIIICRGLGLDPASAAEAKRRLQEVDLIDKSWQPKGWDKRQFASDQSTERVRKYRKNKDTGNVSSPLPKQSAAVTETDQNRTEQNRLREEKLEDEFFDGVKTGDLTPRFNHVKGGAKQFAGLGSFDGKRTKRPEKADQDMVAYLSSRHGMDNGTAWATVMSARDPADERHTECARLCEKISRENKLGWFHEEAV